MFSPSPVGFLGKGVRGGPEGCLPGFLLLRLLPEGLAPAHPEEREGPLVCSWKAALLGGVSEGG